MSKPKRSLVSAALAAAEEPAAVTSPALSRDNVVTLPAEPNEAKITPKRRSPGDHTRHTYHASLYLPDEAQFALREIALTMRRPKPHDVMLEAMAELFEKYNKGELAEECRRRMSSRDKART
jgi:hypothetical protein